LIRTWQGMHKTITGGWARDIESTLITRGEPVPPFLDQAVELLYAMEIVASEKEQNKPRPDDSAQTKAHIYAAGQIIVDILHDETEMPADLKNACHRIHTIFEEVSDNAISEAEQMRKLFNSV